MDTDIVPMEGQFVAVADTDPFDVVEYARKCAMAIKPIINADPKKLEINGKRYLYFESWQTIGWFYGVTSQVIDTYELTTAEGKFRGYGAKANAIRGESVMATAYSECSIDEARWKGRDRYAVLSMAQTRAMAKSLRSCLAWVAVLGGYGSSTAEEMEDMRKPEPKRRPGPKSQPKTCSRELKSVEPTTHERVNNLMASDETGLIARNVVKDKSWNITDTGELSEYQAQVIIAVCEGRDEKDVTYNA